MIFESHCAGCHRVGPVLCRTCRFALAAPVGLPRHSDVVAAVPFAGRARDVLLGFKYGNRRQLAHHFAGLLVNRLLAEGFHPADVDVVTWAPTSRRRRHQRGFDQAEVVARGSPASSGCRAGGCSSATVPPRPADRARPHRAPPRSGVPRPPRRAAGAGAGDRRRRHHRVHVAVGRRGPPARRSARRGAGGVRRDPRSPPPTGACGVATDRRVVPRSAGRDAHPSVSVHPSVS